MTAVNIRAIALLSARSRRSRWIIIAMLLAAGAALGGRASRPAFAQVAPPGTQLAAGDFVEPVTRDLEGSWEAFPADNALGEVLYFWNDLYVSRAYPCSGTGASPACFAWTQYIYDFTDPYNSGLWTLFQRGCMLLGADPVTTGEADGFSTITDIYAVTTPIAVKRSYEALATLNPSAGGSAGISSSLALDSVIPWPCSASGSLPATPGGCAQWSVAGSWTTTQNGNLPVYFNFSQSGTTVTGTASAPTTSLPTGTVSGTLIGNQLNIVVTWTATVQGAYSGTVTTGQILNNGQSHQVGAPPSSSVSWSGTGPATCTGGGGGGGGPTQPSSITGTWDANNGVWTFTQTGNNVTASIAFSGGLGSAHLQGTISNGAVQSTWQCNSDCQIPSGGTVTLTLSSNGCSMQGTYTSVVNGTPTGTGPLTMTKRGCSG
jgi:hypothetical protein